MKVTFPTIVYKCPGNHHCKGGTYGYVQVGTKKEFDEKIKEGYSATLPEAMDKEQGR